jgi:hypothetical protein
MVEESLLAKLVVYDTILRASAKNATNSAELRVKNRILNGKITQIESVSSLNDLISTKISDFEENMRIQNLKAHEASKQSL